ncbi:MAG: OmpA family protein [Sandaracinaceae bacterium]|nr:OmpA family protein [Sandaracinaceae bacterium]
MAVPLASNGIAYAQEFDDFDDLEDEAERPTQGRGGGRARAASRDEFDDDDAFGDAAAEGDDEDAERPPQQPREAAPARPPADAVAAARAFRERRHVLHNTIQGSVGGFHIVDPGSGAAGAFRAQLGLQFFFIDGWLTLPDAPPTASNSHSHVGGTLSLSWNPFDFLELYASIASWANSNEQEEPNLFQVLGDTLFGIKAWYRFEDAPILSIGGDLSVGFLNTVGDIGLVGDSTSVGLRANLGLDLRELENPVPFIARLNLQYWFDNSSALIGSVERARYDALPPSDRRPCPADPALGNCEEDRHLVTRVERYSLQIDRVDRFRVGLGIEAPITVMPDFTISPIAEWVLDIPVNRQGYSCLDTSVGGIVPTGEDACLRGRNATGGEFDRAEAFEQWLTLGVRVMPPLRGMSVFVAVDIGLTGTYTFVRELSGKEPYNVRLGFAWAFDTVPVIQEVEREVIREVTREPEAPPTGRLAGTVVEQGTTTPIAGAIISFPGTELTSLVADSGGRFTTYPLAPGEHTLSVRHPDHNDGTCAGTIAPEGGDVEVRCELVALPRVGSVRGSVRGDDGSRVGGVTVNLSGPANRSLVSSPDGTFTTRDLPPGTYTARVESETHLIRVETFEVRARQEATPVITLIARPRQSLVRVSGRQIVIRRQVNFATDSAEILADSNALLTEIADVIMRHPEVTRIEIQGHTDNRGSRQHNVDLSQRRAEAVRQWLIEHGIDANRLEARGYGPDTPLVPNLTAANRARNRRVQFLIRETQ